MEVRTTPGARSALARIVYSLSTVGSLAALAAVDHRPSTGVTWTTSFVVLLVVSAVVESSFVRRPGWFGVFDAGFVVGLCGLVLVGPVGAAAAIILPDVVGRAVRRHRFWNLATLSTISGLAWGTVIAALALGTAPAGYTAFSAIPALFTAGCASAAVSYATGPGMFAVLRGGRSVRTAVQPFTESLALQLVVVVCGVLVALATGPLGIWALVGFIVAIRLPALLVSELTTFASVHEVGPEEARAAYAMAIADVLALPRLERRLLEDGLETMAGRAPRHLDQGSAELTEAVLHRGERWDGGGGVAGLSGDWIPRVARILAVAEAWSALTARGTLALDHEEALLGLASGAGTRFDPAVVKAAGAVVAAEAPLARRPAFLPRLHRAPVPRAVRRGALPRVLGAAGGHQPS